MDMIVVVDVKLKRTKLTLYNFVVSWNIHNKLHIDPKRK